MRRHYEPAEEYKGAYRVAGWVGIAFYVQGWETVADEDTEWSGLEERTGNLLMVMVGDDRQHVVDPADIRPLERSEYCGECGQIGCHCDAYSEVC